MQLTLGAHGGTVRLAREVASGARTRRHVASVEGAKPMADPADQPAASENGTGEWSRRSFLKTVGAGAAAAAAVSADAVLVPAAGAAGAADAGSGRGSAILSGPVKVTLSINGKDRDVTVEPRTTLLSALRDRLEPAITGPKLVCDAGTCGACTVLLNGKPVFGCSVLAVDAIGKQVTTVEGLGTPEHPNPVQTAFVDKDAMMCGFCTPGFVTSISALLQKNPKPTEQQVREACKGNFCRCGTYPHVFQAALAAAQKT
jgi:xanthine dehydrogenase YagT iron-sulfur-binding subunit